MVWFRRLCMAVGVTAALTVFAAPASAQVAYALAGVETAATSTQGTFVGVALAADDFGTWWAVIPHTEFDASGNATITQGGGFAIDGQERNLLGSIVPGGTIARLPFGSCRKDTFAVTGGVLLDGGGSGVFGVTLTHYGFRLPTGDCFTFFATVKGGIMFALPPSP